MNLKQLAATSLTAFAVSSTIAGPGVDYPSPPTPNTYSGHNTNQGHGNNQTQSTDQKQNNNQSVSAGGHGGTGGNAVAYVNNYPENLRDKKLDVTVTPRGNVIVKGPDGKLEHAGSCSSYMENVGIGADNAIQGFKVMNASPHKEGISAMVIKAFGTSIYNHLDAADSAAAGCSAFSQNADKTAKALTEVRTQLNNLMRFSN